MTPNGNALPPLSRRVKLIAAAVIGLTLFGVVADRRRDHDGTLLVQADAGDLAVTILRDGRPVVVASERRSFVLKEGNYEIVVGPGADWRATPARVSILRDGRTVVRVERLTPAPDGVPDRLIR